MIPENNELLKPQGINALPVATFKTFIVSSDIAFFDKFFLFKIQLLDLEKPTLTNLQYQQPRQMHSLLSQKTRAQTFQTPIRHQMKTRKTSSPLQW